MDQVEFRCETCQSPRVSVPPVIDPDSLVNCGQCGRFVATWADYCLAISLVISSANARTATASDPMRPRASLDASPRPGGAPLRAISAAVVRPSPSHPL